MESSCNFYVTRDGFLHEMYEYGQKISFLQLKFLHYSFTFWASKLKSRITYVFGGFSLLVQAVGKEHNFLPVIICAVILAEEMCAQCLRDIRDGSGANFLQQTKVCKHQSGTARSTVTLHRDTGLMCGLSFTQFFSGVTSSLLAHWTLEELESLQYSCSRNGNFDLSFRDCCIDTSYW